MKKTKIKIVWNKLSIPFFGLAIYQKRKKDSLIKKRGGGKKTSIFWFNEGLEIRFFKDLKQGKIKGFQGWQLFKVSVTILETLRGKPHGNDPRKRVLIQEKHLMQIKVLK